MTTLTEDPIEAGREDPLYAEGTAHLQAGEWQKANKCFEELARRYPGDAAIQSALEETRFKAKMDKSRVRAKQTTIPWGAIVLRVAVLAAVVVVAVVGMQALNRQLAPVLAQAQAERRIAQLLTDGKAHFEAGQLDAAEKNYQDLLALVPDHKDALAGLEQIKAKRGLLGLCAEAEALYTGGDLPKAREKYTEISLQAAGACEASLRIVDINRLTAREDLFAAAEADYRAGQYADATAKYEQIRALDATFKRDAIGERLYDLYMRMGSEIVNHTPPEPEVAPLAVDYFVRSLALQPRSIEAATEQRLANLYVMGRADYASKLWDDAIARLSAVNEGRPGYMGKTAVDPLYDAYIHSGDSRRDAQDYQYAWEQYRRASLLPVDDNTLSMLRMESVRGFLTPTPTPTNTPTVTPMPTPTPYIYNPPTAIPSATPPAPLASYHNQIVFYSDNQDQPGLWVMNPDGTNRRFLGSSGALTLQYEELFKKQSFSPDGRYRVYVTMPKGGNSPQIFIQAQQPDEWGKTMTWQVTHLSKTSYDPVWAPDGSRIAFVSQERTSDDIWVINPDGTEAWNYTKNDWEWDKHPSWSPDSSKIVFWSNREGTKQIFVVDANGRDVHKVSASVWDEYDPLWIK